jgi:catechol 2,3-dioxygenase-like lactoylglutathione lyase family enzyme
MLKEISPLLRVRDLSASVSFYGQKLGFRTGLPYPRLIHIVAIATALLVGTGQHPVAAEAPAQTPLEWHVLLIIKAAGDIKTSWMPDVKYQLTPEEIEAAEVGFSRTTPELVRKLSNGPPGLEAHGPRFQGSVDQGRGRCQGHVYRSKLHSGRTQDARPAGQVRWRLRTLEGPG